MMQSHKSNKYQSESLGIYVDIITKNLPCLKTFYKKMDADDSSGFWIERKKAPFLFSEVIPWMPKCELSAPHQ